MNSCAFIVLRMPAIAVVNGIIVYSCFWCAADTPSVKTLVKQLNAGSHTVLADVRVFLDTSSSCAERAQVIAALQRYAIWHPCEAGAKDLEAVNQARELLVRHNVDPGSKGIWDFASQIQSLAAVNAEAYAVLQDIEARVKATGTIDASDALTMIRMRDVMQANDHIISGIKNAAAFTAWKPSAIPSPDALKLRKEVIEKVTGFVQQVQQLALEQGTLINSPLTVTLESVMAISRATAMSVALSKTFESAKEYFSAELGQAMQAVYQHQRELSDFRSSAYHVDLNGDGVEEEFTVYAGRGLFDSELTDGFVSFIENVRSASLIDNKPYPQFQEGAQATPVAWAMAHQNFPELFVACTDDTSKKRDALQTLAKKLRLASTREDGLALYAKAKELYDSLSYWAKVGLRDPASDLDAIERLPAKERVPPASAVLDDFVTGLDRSPAELTAVDVLQATLADGAFQISPDAAAALAEILAQAAELGLPVPTLSDLASDPKSATRFLTELARQSGDEHLMAELDALAAQIAERVAYVLAPLSQDVNEEISRNLQIEDTQQPIPQLLGSTVSRRRQQQSYQALKSLQIAMQRTMYAKPISATKRGLGAGTSRDSSGYLQWLNQSKQAIRNGNLDQMVQLYSHGYRAGYVDRFLKSVNAHPSVYHDAALGARLGVPAYWRLRRSGALPGHVRH